MSTIEESSGEAIVTLRVVDPCQTHGFLGGATTKYGNDIMTHRLPKESSFYQSLPRPKTEDLSAILPKEARTFFHKEDEQRFLAIFRGGNPEGGALSFKTIVVSKHGKRAVYICVILRCLTDDGEPGGGITLEVFVEGGKWGSAVFPDSPWLEGRPFGVSKCRHDLAFSSYLSEGVWVLGSSRRVRGSSLWGRATVLSGSKEKLESSLGSNRNEGRYCLR